ncbi:hypothetical protein HME9302_00224 [Alteripontixanthobacter maritimus]|uniref:Uncharacterized protein n=1 Tax=Alteripontixanthobacter maritimus TaxID=2161824 RepID=A0A369Q6X6_9SPHN|nr:hypothetical protein [Alteripontixanthobacter maritimus]RDC59047.1 hypothetical protein HME9302_00224 [Alteripontixanthobacter maritimus]
MSIRFTLAAAVLVAASSANASYSSSVDNDGCWDAKQPRGGKCIRQSDHSWNKDKITVTYRNVCGERIYAKVCHDQNDGGRDCGAFGIRGNSDYKYYTYRASGDVSYNAVGSTKSSFDWVCKNRWNMSVK